MIQIYLEARVVGVTESDLEAVGDILDAFRAAVTYDHVTNTLVAFATVERMSMFLAFDNLLRRVLADNNRFPQHMGYTLSDPAA